MSTILARPTKEQVKVGQWSELMMLADIFRGRPGEHCGYRVGTKESITVKDDAGNDVTHSAIVVSEVAASHRKQWPGKGEDVRESVVTGIRYSRRTAARAARTVDLIQTHAPDMTDKDQRAMVSAVHRWVNVDLPDDEYLIGAIRDNRPSLISSAMVESRKLARADAALAAKVKRANAKVAKSGNGSATPPPSGGDAESPRSTNAGGPIHTATVSVDVLPTVESIIGAIRGLGSVTPEDRLALIMAAESVHLTVTPSAIAG